MKIPKWARNVVEGLIEDAQQEGCPKCGGELEVLSSMTSELPGGRTKFAVVALRCVACGVATDKLWARGPQHAHVLRELVGAAEESGGVDAGPVRDVH